MAEVWMNPRIADGAEAMEPRRVDLISNGSSKLKIVRPTLGWKRLRWIQVRGEHLVDPVQVEVGVKVVKDPGVTYEIIENAR